MKAPGDAPGNAPLRRLRCVLGQGVWLLLLAVVILLWGGGAP